jgi:hypothetical protein
MRWGYTLRDLRFNYDITYTREGLEVRGKSASGHDHPGGSYPFQTPSRGYQELHIDGMTAILAKGKVGYN